MKHKDLRFGSGFRVLLGNQQSQTAQMTIPPGGAEGGPNNRHTGADQWLFVIAGTGEAIVNGVHVDMREHSLVLIEQGEIHEIRNTGKEPLRTLNFFVPRADRDNGMELPARRYRTELQARTV
jgi:mannose-6-phosphate isomerase-like protein (cupin superfamily)